MSNQSLRLSPVSLPVWYSRTPRREISCFSIFLSNQQQIRSSNMKNKKCHNTRSHLGPYFPNIIWNKALIKWLLIWSQILPLLHEHKQDKLEGESSSWPEVTWGFIPLTLLIKKYHVVCLLSLCSLMLTSIRKKLSPLKILRTIIFIIYVLKILKGASF